MLNSNGRIEVKSIYFNLRSVEHAATQEGLFVTVAGE